MVDLANGLKFFVAKQENRLAATSINTLTEGQVVLVDALGNLVVASKADEVDAVRIGVKTGGRFYATQLIHYNDIKNYTVGYYAAAKRFVHYIGYNPVANLGQLEGDANVAENHTYSIQIRRLNIKEGDLDKFYWNKTVSYVVPSVLVAGEEQLTLARGLIGQATLDFPATGDGYLLDGWCVPMLVCNNAGTAGTAALAVTKGMNTIVTTQALTVGTGVRIGMNEQTFLPEAQGVKHNTYFVVATPATDSNLAANTYRLDREVSEPTASYIAANWGTITVANTKTSNYGIKLVGGEATYQVGRFGFEMFNSDIWISEQFVNTPVAKNSGSLGHGEGKEVLDTEWFAEHLMRLGQSGEINCPPRNYAEDLFAKTNEKYNVVSIKYALSSDGFTVGSHSTYAHVQVAIPVTTSTGGNQATYSAGDTMPVGIIYGLDTWLTAKTSKTYDYITDLV